MENSFLILNDLIKKMKDIDGIVAYSLFQLPPDNKDRLKILKTILSKKKFISFAVEKITISKIKDLKAANVIWRLKKNLN